MGILKTLSVSHKRGSNGNYCILLQKIQSANQPCLVFEAGTVVSLGPEEAKQVRLNGGYTKIRDGYACLGMIQYAYEGSKEILFLVIVTGCVSVGKIQNSEIFCITEVAMLSMRNGPDDHQLISGVKELLSSGSFYFSHSSMPDQAPYDLTLVAQRAHLTNSTDNRFFWNRLLHRHFERFGIDTTQWLVKVLCGGINISTVYIGGLQAKACMISRLSCERAGTRFNVRGVNDLGHVANFVETEQVIFVNNIVLSFLMIRGSIPLFWEQPGIQVGSHRIKMSRGSEISQAAYDKHMFLLKERFDNVVLINLLSLRESEITLNQLFWAHHAKSKVGSDFPLINFDYHTKCPRGHKDELERLFGEELEKYCDLFGFFHAEGREVIQIQRGIIRTNCLDCLDRTNSTQTFIGLKMLTKMVRSLERVDIVKVLPRLVDIYSGIWAQNGDQISRIYTGTGALEGKNLLKDGTLSVARTIQNNLRDDNKQRAIDILILGRTLNRDYSYRAASLLPHYYMYASPNILIGMCDKYLDYCRVEPLKITVATWNVNGGKHFDNIMYNRARPVSDWLVDYRTSVEAAAGEANLLNETKDERTVDIYAIGFQEIVDLNVGNIVASSTQNQRDWLVEIQKTISRNEEYLLVTSSQLVGVCLFVFIRESLARYIKDVCMDQVKTGLGGATGNKGGVAIRLRYKASSLCFVCAHFAAGQHQVKERNDDYAEITRRIQFPMGRSINSHDYVFWCGDFNYRLDKISNDEVRRAAALNDFNLLLQYDQLKLAQAAGQTFKGYIEGDITFAPTYKYDTNSNDYDTSEKCRVPAYTDRILFKKRHETYPGEELTDKRQIKFYNRIELMSSDHRPVVAEFEIDALEVDTEARSKTLDLVLDQCGPPDATIFVKVHGPLTLADERVFAATLKLLADEAGEIVLVREIDNSLVVIFSDGKSAVQAQKLNAYPLGDHLPNTYLQIEMRTKNWHQVIREELMNNIDNTANLLTGHGPNVHLDDDEDEVAEELNASLGPKDFDSICMNHDLMITPDSTHINSTSCHLPQASQIIPTDHLAGTSAKLTPMASPINTPLPPRSPLHLPTRPPPPPPVSHSPAPAPPLPPRTKRESPPLRPANEQSEAIASDNNNYDNPRSIQVQHTISEPLKSTPDAFGFSNADLAANESSFGNCTFDQSSIDLLDLSASLEYEQSRRSPPTMAPPEPPPITPSKLPPWVPLKSPIGEIPRPTRAAPPPPIPSRSSRNSENNQPKSIETEERAEI